MSHNIAALLALFSVAQVIEARADCNCIRSASTRESTCGCEMLRSSRLDAFAYRSQECFAAHAACHIDGNLFKVPFFGARGGGGGALCFSEAGRLLPYVKPERNDGKVGVE